MILFGWQGRGFRAGPDAGPGVAAARDERLTTGTALASFYGAFPHGLSEIWTEGRLWVDSGPSSRPPPTARLRRKQPFVGTWGNQSVRLHAYLRGFLIKAVDSADPRPASSRGHLNMARALTSPIGQAFFLRYSLHRSPPYRPRSL